MGPRPVTRARRRLAPAAALAAVAALAGCGSGADDAADATDRPAPGSVFGTDARFWVDPQGNAAEAVATLRDRGRRAEADRLHDVIASRPTARWLTTDPSLVYAEARSAAGAGAARGELPVLVAYDVPHRDCGQYSSGGAADADAYLTWVGSLAAGIGDDPVVVVLEPDAVAHTLDDCLTPEQAEERPRLLTEAVRILQRQPGAHVYLDAGNASWVQDLDELAGALRAAGAEEADGFALNVANFVTTERSVAYGERLSEELDGQHFVVDTSRNGAGVPERAGAPGSPTWCNPEDIALGEPPTSDTRHPLVDAFLWVKQPGDSDGACGGGAPEAGTWWPEYADRLVRGAG